MSSPEQQAKLLAQALYEIRGLLADYLGSENSADLPVRVAAHLSYALHNEALALIEGRTFPMNEALRKISVVDKLFDENFCDRYVESLIAERKSL